MSHAVERAAQHVNLVANRTGSSQVRRSGWKTRPQKKVCGQPWRTYRAQFVSRGQRTWPGGWPGLNFVWNLRLTCLLFITMPICCLLCHIFSSCLRVVWWTFVGKVEYEELLCDTLAVAPDSTLLRLTFSSNEVRCADEEDISAVPSCAP